MDEPVGDPALRRIHDVARWLRMKGYGRSMHPASVLLEAADMLTAPLDESTVADRCRRCGVPLPPRTGRRGRPRELCEAHRAARYENRTKIAEPAG